MNSISIKTKFGWITAYEKEGNLIKIRFGKDKNKNSTLKLLKFKKELNLYLKGRKRVFKSKLLIQGNRNQKKIWNELKKIKIGKTKTYGQIAKKFRLSPRYIGKICGQNNFILAIPCHRVISSNGSLGGFSGIGGIKLKKKILEFEKNL